MKPFTLRIRRWFLVAITLLVLGVFAARLITIQIIDSEMYQRMREGRYISTQTVKAARGEILDRNGEPLAVNRMGYDVILERAYLPTGARQNEIILSLIELCERLGEEWTDTLPITHTAPYQFKEGQDAEVTRLKTMLDTQTYATAEETMYWLVERYGLQDFAPEQQRKIASVRYEMEQRDFTWNVPYTFATDIDISSVIQIKERSYQLEGVDVVESAIRTYPNGELAPHIIGLTGPIYAEEYAELDKTEYAMDDRLGKSGAEKAFESILRGSNGQRQIYIGSSEAVQTVETEAPVPGNTVMLTIDNNLQQVSQEALERQINYLQQTAPAGQGKEADSGAVVVLNAKTGEVLAAATYPSYDLSTYNQDYSRLVADETGLPLVNRALQGVYAPGSTFKPVVATTGLKVGEITESSTVFCGQRYTFYQGYQPTCLGAHGNINAVTALTKSCNIFFYDVGRRVGIDNIETVAAQYGLGQPTGIEIPEKIGRISTPAAKDADPNTTEPWYPGDVLQSSIGQLYNEFTPLQLANYAATIGNRGTRMKVTLVHEVRDYSMNTVVQPFVPEIAGTVEASPEAFEVVVKGMVAASTWGGTAAATFGGYPVTVASKTGTPETFDLPNSTFICFAPAEDPEIAIAVVIEKGWHGYTGAPVAKEIFNAYFGFDLPSSASAVQQAETEPQQTASAETEQQPEEQQGTEPETTSTAEPEEYRLEIPGMENA